MDEPTNHLDVRSRETLIEAMSGFKGAILFASHDTGLLDALATHVAEVGDGKVKLHTTDYAGFKEKKEAEDEEVEEDERVVALEEEIERLQDRIEAIEDSLGALQGPAKLESEREHAEATSRLAAAEAELENWRWPSSARGRSRVRSGRSGGHHASNYEDDP